MTKSHESFDEATERFLGTQPIKPETIPQGTFDGVKEELLRVGLQQSKASQAMLLSGSDPALQSTMGQHNSQYEMFYPHSSVRRAKYMADEKILEIEFASGAVYHYQGILPITWEALQKCEAPGKFVHSDLKDYKYEKINQNAK